MVILLYVPIREPGEKVVPGKSAAALIRILCMEIREPEKGWSPETLCCSVVNDRTCSNNGSGIDYQRLAAVVCVQEEAIAGHFAIVLLRVVCVQIRFRRPSPDILP